MKKIQVFVLLFLAISSLTAHSVKNHEHHSHDAHSHEHNHHHHSHDDSSSDHDHEHHGESSTSNNISSANNHTSAGLFYDLSNFSENKYVMVTIAVIIISAPSIPVFIGLMMISKMISSGSNHILSPKIMRPMLALAVGSLVGDVFFCMMEHLSENHHADDHHSHNHSLSNNTGTIFIVIGIFVFYAFDRLMGQDGDQHGHSHTHDHISHDSHISNSKKDKQDSKNFEKNKNSKVNKKEEDSGVRNRNQTEKGQEKKSEEEEVCGEKKMQQSVFLYLLADFLHNAVDGLAIGASFSLNNKLGMSTMIAIGIHELPHEIGDFAVLISKNYSLYGVLGTQLMTATGALFGGYIGLFFGDYNQNLLLGFTAGGFLYLALAKMIPELLNTTKKANLIDVLIEFFWGMVGAGLIIYSH